jgi:hypothetical protein
VAAAAGVVAAAVVVAAVAVVAAAEVSAGRRVVDGFEHHVRKTAERASSPG